MAQPLNPTNSPSGEPRIANHEPRAPKGIAWLVIYHQPGKRVSYVEVEHNGHGLTAYEAWAVSSVPVAFHQAQLIQLEPYPSPLSVNTKQAS